MKKISSSLLGAIILASLYSPTVQASDGDVGLLNDVMDQMKIQEELNRDTPLNNFRKEITAQYAEQGLVVTPDDPHGPLTLEGNNIVYDSVGGDYQGQGDIKLTHNFSRILTEEIKGNTTVGEVDINTPAHFLQLEDPKVDLQAATTQYDYQKGTGHLTKVEGRIDRNYIKGEELTLEGGNYTLDNGIITRCSAEKPPYYIQADKVVVTPEAATFYKPRFVLHGKVIYSKDLYVVKLNQPHKEHREGASWFPYKIRYSNRNGVTFGYNYDHKLMDKVFLYTDLRYSTKTHEHNIYGVIWENGPQTFKVESGKYEDEDNRWLRKKYSIVYDYGHRVGQSPFTYNFHNEYGLWKEDGILGHHREHRLTFYRDPLFLSETLSFHPMVGYKIIKDSGASDHMRKGLYYSGTFVNRFSPKVVGYAGYHYTRTDASNTVFKFGQREFAKEVSLGVGVAITPIDRIIVASEFNGAKAMALENLNYYWQHDFKFLSSELKYEQKKKRISIHLNFYDF